MPLAESLYSSYCLIRKCVELFTAVGGSFFWLAGLAIADERRNDCSTTVEGMEGVDSVTSAQENITHTTVCIKVME